jgi:type IV secretory pathway VirD2 relaxase
VSDFRTVPGFDEVWRPVGGRRVRPPEVLRGAGEGARARLSRIVGKAPEVMVKVTGRARGEGHLAAHLQYITRRGELEAEDRDGALMVGRGEVGELATDWEAMADLDQRRTARTPTSLSIVLSMPASTDPIALRDAARDFAGRTFGEAHDYVFVLHTDAGHPHVHLTVRALGDHGQRLNPKKADLDSWRQAFAEALRDRGVEAEATPRRARGVVRKAEKTPVRKLQERLAASDGGMPFVTAQAYRDAAPTAVGAETANPPWETAIARRQARIRALYLSQARLLAASAEPEDRALARAVARFVAEMPPVETQRLALARRLREAGIPQLEKEQGRDGVSRERGR